MFIEIAKLVIYLTLVVLISKTILVKYLRKLAEALNLKSKTIGNVSGFATSIPELLTTCTSSVAGLPITATFNIISSNIINLIQYLLTVVANKNVTYLKNRAIRANLAIVGITIAIPIYLIITKNELDITVVPFLIITYLLSIMLNRTMHKLYLKKEDKEIEKTIEREAKIERKKRKAFLYFIILLFTGVLLFLVGDLLGKTLETLCEIFNVSQVVMGIILGFFTSMPELITFYEAQRHHNDKNSDGLGMIEATNNLMMSNSMNLFVIFTIGIIIGNLT